MRFLPFAGLLIAAPAFAQPAAQAPSAPSNEFEATISAQVGEQTWALMKANANVKMLSEQVASLSKELAQAKADLEAAKKGAALKPADAPKP